MKNVILVLSFLLVFGCKSPVPGPDVEIEWRGGDYYTYRYSHGIMIGGTWHHKFEVTDGSGDVTFKVYVNGSKKKSETFTVEEGHFYKLDVSIGTGGCWGNSSSIAKIKSSSVSSSRELETDCSQMDCSSISVTEVTD